MKAVGVTLMAVALAACGAIPSVSTSVTAAATSTPFSITSPTYVLLDRIASDAYTIVTDINTVTMIDLCAVTPSYQCQTAMPEAMTEELQHLQQDVASLVTSGVLAAYSYSSPIGADLRNLQDDLNQLPDSLGLEIEGLESDNPDELRSGAQAQADLAGIDNAALAIRNALTAA